MYQWPEQAQFMTILTFIWPYDLDPQPTWKMFQMALLLEDNNCVKLF